VFTGGKVERVGKIVPNIEIGVGLVQCLNVRECHGIRISVPKPRSKESWISAAAQASPAKKIAAQPACAAKASESVSPDYLSAVSAVPSQNLDWRWNAVRASPLIGCGPARTPQPRPTTAAGNGFRSADASILGKRGDQSAPAHVRAARPRLPSCAAFSQKCWRIPKVRYWTPPLTP